MPNPEWIKNLAKSKFIDGSWNNDDQEDIEKTTQFAISDAINQLFEECSDTASQFNIHSIDQRGIRVLPISQDRGQGQGGIMLLMGKIQINVEMVGQNLVCKVNTVNGFQRSSRTLSKLSPQVDPFGSVLWFADKSMLLSTDQLTQRLFEQLVRASDELPASR